MRQTYEHFPGTHSTRILPARRVDVTARHGMAAKNAQVIPESPDIAVTGSGAELCWHGHAGVFHSGLSTTCQGSLSPAGAADAGGSCADLADHPAHTP